MRCVAGDFNSCAPGGGSYQLAARIVQPTHCLAKHFQQFPFATEVEQAQFTHRVEKSVDGQSAV
eukprot:4092959-Pyramimonas_sp.AAC.1